MKIKVFVCFLLVAALCAGLFGCGGSDWEDPARTTVGSDWEDPNRTDWEDPAQTTTGSDWEDPGKTDWEDGGNGYAPQLASASAGSVVLFGRYEQDNDLSNGAEPIAWQVLTREGNRIFVVSVYALDCKPYNTEDKAVSWEDCTLRKWLNEDFLSSAFTSEERDAIPAVEVPPGDNYMYADTADFGRATRDRVFCLSASEMYAYLDTDGDYHNDDPGYNCEATDYAHAMGASVLPSDKWGDVCCYWLRGPGHEANYAMTCDARVIGYFGLVVWMTDAAVRPAMWINVGEGGSDWEDPTDAPQADGIGRYRHELAGCEFYTNHQVDEWIKGGIFYPVEMAKAIFGNGEKYPLARGAVSIDVDGLEYVLSYEVNKNDAARNPATTPGSDAYPHFSMGATIVYEYSNYGDLYQIDDSQFYIPYELLEISLYVCEQVAAGNPTPVDDLYFLGHQFEAGR